MTTQLQTADPVVAGLIQAKCTCCEEPQQLMGHPELDTNRLMCPVSQQVYLDRGDGLFEALGTSLENEGLELTSDRPQRTGPKTRIQLERATFAKG